MPETVTVWMVPLTRGGVSETKGMIAIQEDAVVFTEAKSGGQRRFPFSSVRRAKRVRGSPILLLSHSDGEATEQIAFYFSQPPPLQPPDPGSISPPSVGLSGRPMGPFAAMRRNSKRRHQRSNLTYLTLANPAKKTEIEAWVREIRTRIAARA